MEYRGIEYLRNKLELKRPRVLERYKFYDAKESSRFQSYTLPPQMQDAFRSCVGWCAKAVDTLADRLVFRGFENDNFDINKIFSMNNPDTFFDSSILSALIAACCFTYISPDENNFPRLQVIDGGNATGVIDPITALLNEGYAVLERDDNGSPILEAYFIAYETRYYAKGMSEPYVFKHSVPYPLLVPIIYRPDASRPFGHSRISRACMSLQNKAKAVITRADITAEFYSFPQKYMVGMSADADPLDKWKATVSSFLQVSRDEDGNVPTLGQFAQQSMQPHIEHFKMYASAFSGETGLTLDDLGFPTDNPSSAEAIKAAHENLRLTARKAQRTFGSGFLNVGYLAACLRDDFAYRRKQFYLTTANWEPIFEPDSAMLSAIGDGVLKINQAVPEYITPETVRDLTGISRK